MKVLKEKIFLYTISGFETKPVQGSTSPKLFKDSLEYKPQDTDLFVISYPKCGTTWIQYIINVLENDVHPPKSGFNQSVSGILFRKGKSDEDGKSKDFKKSSIVDMVPYNPKAKYVHVVRNPFDCCVAYYHHHIGIKAYEYEGEFDDYFELFIRGEVDYGDYFDHLMSWYAHKDDDNVLLLTYEEMHENTFETVVKLGKFMGGKYAKFVSDAEVVNRVIAHAQFDVMKELGNKMATEAMHLFNGRFNLCRKGIIGDYKNYFSKHQIERLKQKYNSKLKATHLLDIWNRYIE